MNLILNMFFIIMSLVISLYLYYGFKIQKILKFKHKNIWETLGRPYFTNISYESITNFNKFVIGKEIHKLNDNDLILFRRRWLIFRYLSFLSFLMIFILLSFVIYYTEAYIK